MMHIMFPKSVSNHVKYANIKQNICGNYETSLRKCHMLNLFCFKTSYPVQVKLKNSNDANPLQYIKPERIPMKNTHHDNFSSTSVTCSHSGLRNGLASAQHIIATVYISKRGSGSSSGLHWHPWCIKTCMGKKKTRAINVWPSPYNSQ